MNLKSLFVLLILLIHVFFAYGQSFEGTIELAKYVSSDTLYYSYHIKDEKIRIDELDNKKSIQKYILIDFEKQTMQAINPNLKLYAQLPVKPYVSFDDINFEIIKSENSKEINGYVCYQWRVRNQAQNTDVTYWVARDGFDFYTKILRMLNSADRSSSFFLQIDDTEGVLPMSIVERSTLWQERISIQVVNILRKELTESMFNVPQTYTAFDR